MLPIVPQEVKHTAHAASINIRAPFFTIFSSIVLLLFASPTQRAAPGVTALAGHTKLSGS